MSFAVTLCALAVAAACVSMFGGLMIFADAKQTASVRIAAIIAVGASAIIAVIGAAMLGSGELLW